MGSEMSEDFGWRAGNNFFVDFGELTSKGYAWYLELLKLFKEL